MAIFGPSLTTLSHKKMRLSEPATVVNSERLKPPYVGVKADLVIRLFLPFLSFHNCCACTYVPLKARILAMSPAKWLHPPTSTTELTSQLFLLARFICAYYKRASLRSEQQKFDSWITIQECSTLRYLTIKGDQLVLSDCLKRDANNFCLWTRQGNSNGIQSGLSDNFIGQSFLGNLVCSNSKFGRNEEVEFSDVNLDQTRIVISSAGWGKGDYIKWSEKKDGKGKLGFCGGHDKKATATIWKITKIAGPETAVEKNRELI